MPEGQISVYIFTGVLCEICDFVDVPDESSCTQILECNACYTKVKCNRHDRGWVWTIKCGIWSIHDLISKLHLARGKVNPYARVKCLMSRKKYMSVYWSTLLVSHDTVSFWFSEREFNFTDVLPLDRKWNIAKQIVTVGLKKQLWLTATVTGSYMHTFIFSCRSFEVRKRCYSNTDDVGLDECGRDNVCTRVCGVTDYCNIDDTDMFERVCK